MKANLPSELLSLQLPLRIRIGEAQAFDLGPDPQVTLVVRDPTLLTEITHPNLDILGRAYVEGRMDIEGPMQEVIATADALSAALGDADDDADYVRKSHDKATDAEAIHYHYDLSNAFYQLWLDPEMVYSCAYYETGNENLATAQLAKLRHLCRKLRLKPGEKLLDVGCGWGGLARLAAREFGVEVHGITLSEEQLKLGRERVEADGLEGKVTLELRDYRDLPRDGRYDKVVSVGMFEHVGHANLGLYFQHLYDAVRPGGLVMNHGITSSNTDGRPVGRGAGDFIDRYVFPHGELPHLSLAVARMSEAGLEVVDVEGLRMHYARTLDFWSANLEAKLAEAAKLVPDQALRIWRLYLAGCAYGFKKGWINLHQILASKPHTDGGHEVPWSRRDLYT
ncbi:C17 cyclopropane fatty acid synthase CfaB [Pseudomonas nicosulfuronedens]|uniref:Methyltransferase domain-containing protein n=1 Tax=Pseudomonas nicosulfuronedens TaxID=2571105 RepID=A0A5R9RT33_9PSED|nr:C17 cyclopropane fatty acid synthase CfaB [Pseudomonas nicosulfuronedens]MDH1009230.1 C17 cyclopropane fatty acid synthase CfaB [Pseudomonas nicosulfuronedens]MDH1978142.1 C17 cyclopropane fatty acid synthase CfaB [Pseudomonas nicosulfuronedens]MDH2026978.1 C17 cyclopropane fatty acid synthase CfaB [Pseudomonas nicosulfuronedens]TLX81131.1 methyltransferase domain-containing protein [Pseudomonas nicosulfuronedens]